MSSKRTYSLRTRWSDADAQGVLNNAVYLTLFEEARHALALELGLLDDEGNFPFLLARTEVDFKSPGKGGARVLVAIETTKLGTSSFTQRYTVSSETGSIWAEGTAILVCYDPSSGASQPMTDSFRIALAAD